MHASIQTFAMAHNGHAGKKHDIRLVGIHSMDDPAINGAGIADQYESAARIGLDRVGANYALTIPFVLAQYDDLWRANEQRLNATRLPRQLDKFGPFLQLHPLSTVGDPVHAALEVHLALEMLGNSRNAFQGTGYDTANPVFGMMSGGESKLNSGPSQNTLWQRATNIATYLTSPSLRDLTLRRVAAEIEAGDDPVVLLAHGLGSLVGYELMMRRPDLPVRCLVTLGSPLGLAGVRSALAASHGTSNSATLPFPSRLPRWINLYNSADPVASSHLLSPVCAPAYSKDSRHIEDIDTGKLGFPYVADIFNGNHPATYLASKTAGIVLRSVVEA